MSARLEHRLPGRPPSLAISAMLRNLPPCPVCWANRGESCILPGGQNRPPHRVRRLAAWRERIAVALERTAVSV